MAAARRVIAAKGLADVRVSDIAQEAGISQGTFYSHFESKRAMVQAIVAEAIDGLSSDVDHYDQMTPVEAYSFSVRRFINLAVTDLELARLLIGLEDARPLFHEQSWGRAEKIIRRGVSRGDFHVDDVELALEIALATVHVTLRALVEGRTRDGASDTCVMILLQSMGVSRSVAMAAARKPLT